MRISVNDEINVIEIWTAPNERNNAEFIKAVTEIQAKTSGSAKRRTVIFESGADELEACTRSLIKNNL